MGVEINQFTISGFDAATNKNEPSINDEFVKEYAIEAGSIAGLIKPIKAQSLAINPDAGLRYAPIGATQDQRNKAALAFATEIVGIQGREISNDSKNYNSNQYLKRALSLITTSSDILSKVDINGNSDLDTSLRRKDNDSRDEIIRSIASQDSNKTNISAEELAKYIIKNDKNCDGAVLNGERKT
jgi:hypothetical protein